MSISPELALAAAAAIGDKALQEQTKELLELKRQLAESRKVEITGSGGRPVYARGQFEDGKLFNSSRSWWDVPLTICEGNDGIFLTNLQHLEIRLGGIVYATLSEDEVQGHDIVILDNNSNGRSDNIILNRCRNMLIPIESGGGCRIATIQIDLRDMPEPPWKLLKSSISYNLTESNVSALIDVFDILTGPRQLPVRLPNQVVDLISISFDVSSVQSMLSCMLDGSKKSDVSE